MQVHGHLYGGAPILAKIQIGEALPDAGVPLAPAGEDVPGVLLTDTDSAAALVGVSLDARPDYLTTQQLGNADPAVYVTVSTRPDIILRARLSGSEVSGTPLPEFRNTVLSSDGTLITGAFGDQYFSAAVFGASGANGGQLRRLHDANEGEVHVAFPFDIAVGDLFYAASLWPYAYHGAFLTDDLTEINATQTALTVENFKCLGLRFQPKGSGGALNSFADLAIKNHWIPVAQ